MKAELHPEYHETTIKCACGNEVKTRSTVRDLHVEICSACHPFYTGKQKLVDSAGRIEKFNRKYKNLRSAPAPTAAPEPAPAAEAAPAEEAASAPESAPH